MSELLPCPFCGGEAELHDGVVIIPVIDENGAYIDADVEDTPAWVECAACGAATDGVDSADEAIAAWNRRAQPDITGETSDGYHTFNELYHHRAVLFSVICNSRPDIAWRAKRHHDGTMYDGMFIVGINTPDGQATYHYDVEPYWEMFRVRELPQAPEWDGHTPAQAIERIGRLSAQPNAPLTLEELRGMDGEPVYIVAHPDWGHWELSVDAEDYFEDRDEDFYGMTYNDPAGRYGLHALGWLAYRRKITKGE